MSKYFLVLHNQLSLETIRSYQEKLDPSPSSELFRWLNLLELRVPVPAKAFLLPGFLQGLKTRSPEFLGELNGLIEAFESNHSAEFGSQEKPLLVTIRGDHTGTIRNLGVSEQNLPALIHIYGPAMAFRIFVDFLESFSALGLGASFLDFRKKFEISNQRDMGLDGLSNEEELSFLQKVREYKSSISKKIGMPFPEKPEQQLLKVLEYLARQSGNQKGEMSLQAQLHPSIFGQSTHGVFYTRNPFTGKKDLYGVFQGRDAKKKTMEVFKETYPGVFSEIRKNTNKVESSFRQVMEVEFVCDEDGHLRLTQFDKPEITAKAAIVSAIELNREELISDFEVASRIQAKDIESFLHPSLDESSKAKLQKVGHSGVTAAPGTAVGHVFFKMKDAIDFYQESLKDSKKPKIILIADELLISDTPGLGMISGLVTKASGLASHAAVMARANGIPCIVGFQGLEVSADGKSCRLKSPQESIVSSGTLLTLDAGNEGCLYLGEGELNNVSYEDSAVQDLVRIFTRLKKQLQIPLDIRVNISNPKDAQIGKSFGAEGVGLCRTENMFMEAENLREIRNIVFTANMDLCQESLRVLEEAQFSDFKKIFSTMNNHVVNIRLMDLPLHDFVPQTAEDFEVLGRQLPHLTQEHIRLVADNLKEHNPMLGLRGCRFGIIHPEIYDLQIRAIVKAAYATEKRGPGFKPGIMFPLVFMQDELARLKQRVFEIEEGVKNSLGISADESIHIRIGSMIELPAAALNADHLAKVGEFFAFGTNDLTQTTLGMSRDDSSHYLPHYLERGLLSTDPFKVLCEPVRELIETAVSRGLRVRPDASYGICGEQGGDPSSLVFCLEKGLSYISCSPFRVLAALSALIKMQPHGESSEFRTPSASYKGEIDPPIEQLRAG